MTKKFKLIESDLFEKIDKSIAQYRVETFNEKGIKMKLTITDYYNEDRTILLQTTIFKDKYTPTNQFDDPMIDNDSDLGKEVLQFLEDNADNELEKDA